MSQHQKVAIVHDWLIGGGAEKVVEEIHKIYPDAPIFTSYCTDEWRKKLGKKVVTGYLQNWPFSKLRKYLPILMSNWYRSLNLDSYDLIIVSSGNGAANHIKKPPGSTLIFYCHTPTHYLWDKNEEYLCNPGFGIFNPLVRFGLKTFIGKLQKRDLEGAEQANVIAANSSHIKEQIKKYYKKDSIVIFPSVDLDRFSGQSKKEREGFVVVGRQVPYKRFDIVVSACKQLDLKLTVVGKGPEHSKLVSLAGTKTTFLTDASDKEVEDSLVSSEGFIFPSEEDFGIAPVEAIASGCPVIAYKAGGALDYVIEGKTGTFFEKQTTESLVGALRKFDSESFNSQDLAKEANRFSAKNFRKNILEVIARV